METEPSSVPPRRPKPPSADGPTTFRDGFWPRFWYGTVRIGSRMLFGGLYRARVAGLENIPPGASLILSNHQSHFDPPLVGYFVPQRIGYLARRTLFEVPLLRSIIRSLNAIPVERDGLGLAGLKETLRYLKSGHPVLVFPEGTRTGDGLLGEIKPGFSALAVRANVPLLPVGIAGAFEAWPRNHSRPHCCGRLAVCFGKPIPPEEFAHLEQRDVVTLVGARIAECFARARALRAGRGDGDSRIEDSHVRISQSGDNGGEGVRDATPPPASRPPDGSGAAGG